MGADLSACCGGQENKDTQIDISNVPQESTPQYKRATPEQSPSGPSSPRNRNDGSKRLAFRRRLEEGISANLILQDKSKLTCLVRFDPGNECLLLSCDKKVRAIALRDIKTILHTKEHLRRVEASAGITNSDTCAAIHLAASGNCIPLFFTNPRDKSLFVEVVEDGKRANEERDRERSRRSASSSGSPALGMQSGPS